MKMQYNLPCNIAQTLNIIGDKWSLLILHQILVGRETYKEIHDELTGIPTNLLSERLKSLEIDGLIKRELYQSHPPRNKYTLTKKGYDLEDVFNSIILWGEKHLDTCYKKLVHKNCNHSIEHRYYCSNCNKVVKIEDISVLDPNEQ
ncbi:winged helix-turn-helix transcriptional regulator [Sedimentibacter sp. MB31-C6]|uniref:winged helix-turn-helix transcriptional regulator n=1 Tax=Sedimentibacter sp. MB31-C6 TaxID=3109366 RepID=UPI002DDCE489|nr:winged helix-turn-helix transcriptional regulator [Sedimentibacter sp. MB36-C1]WSI05442.1 winged helix-turn-helix transcriptional regulator [Sedimentibacter sp. MB36-C1]